MMNKRKFISTIIGSLAYLTTNISDAAFIYRPKQEVKGIPKSWVDKEGVKVMDYARFILDLKLKNITPRMILEPHFKSRRGIANELPPKEMWKTIAPTLKAIDKIVDKSDLKINKIISAYRSPKYNRAVRGHKCSYHMQNNAVDVNFSNVSPWKASKIMKEYRTRGEFKGGIGTYRSFIHVDTRGENASW